MGPGKTNALQRANLIAPGNSSNNFSNIFTIVTLGSTTNYLDLGAATSAPVHFYRLRLMP
jgi:hypothetical protein